MGGGVNTGDGNIYIYISIGIYSLALGRDNDICTIFGSVEMIAARELKLTSEE